MKHFIPKFCLLALAYLCASIPSFADSIIIGIGGVPGSTPTGSTNLYATVANDGFAWTGFSFTLGQSYSNVSVTTLWTSAFGVNQVPLTTWLTNGIGPGTTSSDLLASSTTFLLGEAIVPVTVFSASTLGPGTYDVLFSTFSIETPSSIPLNQAFTYTAPRASVGDVLLCLKCGDVSVVSPPAPPWSDTGETSRLL